MRTKRAFGYSSDPPNPHRLVVSGSTDVPTGNGIAWKFYSAAAADEIGEAKIWGISKLSLTGQTDEHMAEFLVHVDLTVGTATTHMGNILPAGKFIDTITMREDRSLVPGARVISNADNGVAVLLLDGFGYMGYIIEMAKVTGTGGYGALYRTL